MSTAPLIVLTNANLIDAVTPAVGAGAAGSAAHTETRDSHGIA